MSFLEWLEYGAIGVWVAESAIGYPFVLSMHAIGLAVVVGVLFVVDLRMAGCFQKLEIVPLLQMLKLAWAGFVINFVSGCALFASQATDFIANPAFIIKIIAIFLALINASFLQQQLRQYAESWDKGEQISTNARALALTSLFLWSVAIIAGRLIAYTEI